MNDESIFIFLGVVGGILLSILFSAFGPTEENQLIAKCESALPRTQHCVLIAVPKKEKP